MSHSTKERGCEKPRKQFLIPSNLGTDRFAQYCHKLTRLRYYEALQTLRQHPGKNNTDTEESMMSTFDAEDAGTAAALFNVQGRMGTYCKKGAPAKL